VTAAARRAERLSSAAADQAGMLSRAQLRELGVDSDQVRNHIRGGRWQAWGRRVVALNRGPLSDEQISWYAVLDGGDGCVLAGLSALHASGLKGFNVERLQTAVPLGRTPARHELFVRRECRRLVPEAVHPARRPPMMRVEPAILDALEHMTLPLRGCALLAAVVQQRLIPAARLRPLIAEASTLRHRANYFRIAGDIEGGSHSLAEINFLALARAAGICPPRRQAVRLDAHGKRRYLDADFGGFSVEVDGAVHLKPLTWWDDMFRHNDIVLGSKPVLRFPSVGIYLSRAAVIAQLRQAAVRWPS
jgi:hypothetical protein